VRGTDIATVKYFNNLRILIDMLDTTEPVLTIRCPGVETDHRAGDGVVGAGYVVACEDPHVTGGGGGVCWVEGGVESLELGCDLVSFVWGNLGCEPSFEVCIKWVRVASD
jgi:hypothetical protein